jgi:uncharacterized membrane protein
LDKNLLKPILIISLTTFVAHYLFFRDFGLYEDDYFYIPKAMSISFSDLLTGIGESFLHWSQGRPLIFLPSIFTFLGIQSGGLSALYFMGFLILSANSILFYILLKRVYPGSEMFALTGALAFCLFPGDTSKIILSYTYILQMSLMFLIVASILYLYGYKAISYFVIIGSLFSYETVFIVFYGIPLLKPVWNARLRKELVWHGIILSVILAVYTAFRSLMGEQRMNDALGNILDSMYKIAASLFIGPLTNIYMFLRAPAVTVIHWDTVFIIVFILGLSFFTLVFFRMRSRPSDSVIVKKLNFDLKLLSFKGEFQFSAELLKVLRICAASAVLLCMAYVLSFTHYPPTVVAGGLTSVHLAATFGGSMIFACIVSVFWIAVERGKGRYVFILLLSAYLSLLVGYRLLIQRDFVQSWILQKEFWSRMIELCPDMKENTLIFLISEGQKHYSNTTYISSLSYVDPIVPALIFDFPKEWINPPRLFHIRENLEEDLRISDGEVEWNVPAMAWEAHWEKFPDSNAIFLRLQNGDFNRIDTVINFEGVPVASKPLSSSKLNDYKRKKLYEYLIEER